MLVQEHELGHGLLMQTMKMIVAVGMLAMFYACALYLKMGIVCCIERHLMLEASILVNLVVLVA